MAEEIKKTVKVGVRDFEFAPLTDAEKVVGDPERILGLRQATLNVTVNQEDFNGDDGVFAILDGGISELTLDVEVADVQSAQKKSLLGIEIEDGMEIYKKDLKLPYVACTFRSTTNTGKAVWFGLAKGKFGLPNTDLGTNEGSPNPNPDSLSARFEARADDIMYIIAREDNEDFDLEAFKAKIYPKVTP